MSYNWEKASTPQGRERLKELMDLGEKVPCKWKSPRYGHLPILHRWAYKSESRYCLGETEAHNAVSEIFTDGLEFLDPSPSPEPVADENGLLSCPFCGGKADVFGEALMCSIGCKSCELGFLEVGHSAYANLKAKWNRRAGKEINQ